MQWGSWELVSLVCPCLGSTFEAVCPVPQFPGDPMLLQSGTWIPDHISLCHSIAFPPPLPTSLKLFLRICSTKGKQRQKMKIRECVEWIEGVRVQKRSKDKRRTVNQRNIGNLIQSEGNRWPVVKDEVRRVTCRLHVTMSHISCERVCNLSECH